MDSISAPISSARLSVRLASTVMAVALLLAALPGNEARAETPLGVQVRAVRFPNPSLTDSVMVEFPFVLMRNQLEFFRPDSSDERYFSRVYAQLKLIDSYGQVTDSASTYFSVTAPTPEAARQDKSYRIFNKLALLVPPGVYSARLSVIDAVSKWQGESFIDQVVAVPPAAGHLKLSDPALAYLIQYVGDSASSGASRMVRNGFSVLDNPSGLFGHQDSVLYLYGEVYGLGDAADDTAASAGKYSVSYVCLNEAGEVYRDLGTRTVRKPGKSAVIAESFDIKYWPAGLYRLQIAAEDHATADVDTVEAVFRIISVSEIAEIENRGIQSTWEPYDTLSIEVKTQLVHYLLSPSERSTFDHLDYTGKENFLRQFWKDRDPDRLTPVNEFRLQWLKRFEFANRYFSTGAGLNDGWQTDRGRIYLNYGPWDRIDDFPAPVVGQPYVVWWYDAIEEGLVFVFVDREGYGDYTLVHSNAEGEIYSAYWHSVVTGSLEQEPVFNRYD